MSVDGRNTGEAPFITSYANEVIAPGMVLAIECFLGGKTGEGTGFEHIVSIGETGVEVLTNGTPARPWLQA